MADLFWFLCACLIVGRAGSRAYEHKPNDNKWTNRIWSLLIMLMYWQVFENYDSNYLNRILNLL